MSFNLEMVWAATKPVNKQLSRLFVGPVTAQFSFSKVLSSDVRVNKINCRRQRQQLKILTVSPSAQKKKNMASALNLQKLKEKKLRKMWSL